MGASDADADAAALGPIMVSMFLCSRASNSSCRSKSPSSPTADTEPMPPLLGRSRIIARTCCSCAALAAPLLAAVRGGGKSVRPRSRIAADSAAWRIESLPPRPEFPAFLTMFRLGLSTEEEGEGSLRIDVLSAVDNPDPDPDLCIMSPARAVLPHRCCEGAGTGPGGGLLLEGMEADELLVRGAGTPWVLSTAERMLDDDPGLLAAQSMTCAPGSCPPPGTSRPRAS
mmetsp:Transcript_13777/g.29696  ORF Transcript_13777/g.29696 Transcript_13777/m.29696 type:complete len:228 (-) Transcript_13777:1008-1691(-)